MTLPENYGRNLYGNSYIGLIERSELEKKDVGSVAWLVRILMSVGLEVRIEQYSQKERFYFEDDCR